MTRIAELAPLAITMWDTGWLTRYYKSGSFMNWNKAFDDECRNSIAALAGAACMTGREARRSI